MSVNPEPRLDELARMVATGEVRITAVRVNVCPHCMTGTVRYAGTPDWMNRWVCDRCGGEVSK